MDNIIVSVINLFMGQKDTDSLLEKVNRLCQNKLYQKAILLIDNSSERQQEFMELRDSLVKDAIDYISNTLKQGKIEFARQLYEDAKQNNILTDDASCRIEKEMHYYENLQEERSLCRCHEYDKAGILAQNSIKLYDASHEEAAPLFEQICEQQKNQEIENCRKGPWCIINMGTFNVPKKENEGEDADPISMVDPNLNWGFVGVFDGMGGAGAKKYKHVESGEEHTSAYWGSRIVKDCVEELISNRSKGVSPIAWVDNHIHETIKSKLDEKIKEFPNANGAVLSKMTRKLPTTMAMSGYEIVDDEVAITTYWAGDSRVYILLKDTIKILTIDDANAEDGDPFSPLNMDLAMSNAISQEREFRINRSVVKLPISQQDPFLLIASTDGCFGYFKNPIEFEAMLRNCLGNANDCNEYLNNIKEAIIENIQQDDFSISIAGFGDNVFEDYKSVLSADANVELIKEYYRWREDVEKQRSDFKSRISDLETQLKVSREEEERLHSIEEQKNLEWYAKYKETFTVINREDIESI